ncbi:hypothetical protein EVAR_24573_1 [Eumeta japonica]|uniref:Uncharacterized protein n=1 Tax=Eumeta variegata TaxID=151549 RepID=A0A4C1W3Q9_EUMVA|nr:hypothetical protein EVAR_24573_1 [Eumeta japonica]
MRKFAISLQSMNRGCIDMIQKRLETRARRTASADWWITPGTAGMRPRDLFTTSRDYRESVGVAYRGKRNWQATGKPSSPIATRNPRRIIIATLLGENWISDESSVRVWCLNRIIFLLGLSSP